MDRRITITSGALHIEGMLSTSPTADAVWNCLPLHASVNIWGEEIYFSIPVQADLEADAKEVVETGDMGYWPSGAAFCIFFGPTPVSRPGEIRPASAVNVFGKVTGDTEGFKKIADGSAISIAKAL
ncbi:MAG: cyclophilin-like fold protein [Proteobacteria bacterium]|nr:cyclophilin-like fold protein [Pseudomonadota bacterium]